MGSRRALAAVAAAAMVMTAVSVADAAVVGPHPVTTWQANGTVTTTVISGNTIYLGGKFTAMLPSGTSGTGAVTRNHVAAIDMTTGQLLPWDPNVNNTVNALAVSGTTVYLGGTFTHVGTASRKNLAAVDATTGAVITGFRAPALNAGVMAIAPGPTGLYVGGAFTTVGSTSRAYAAEFDPGTGAFMPGWAPVVDNYVRAIALTLDGTRVILGGDFNHLNGAWSISIGAVDPSAGASLPWAWHGPLAFFRPFQVVGLAVDANGVYAAGTGNGGSFMRFDPNTGALDFIGGTNGNVTGVGLDGGMLYLGGHFTAYCGLVPGNNTCTPAAMRDKLMAVDEVTGALQTWHPSANKNLGVFTLTAGNGGVAVGGDFTKIGGVVQQGFAEFHE